MTDFLKHPYVRELLSLGLPSRHFVIAGSGPLFARGMIDTIGDLDIVARGPAWKMSCRLGTVQPAPIGPTRQVRMFDGDIEVLDGWFGWDVDTLIDGADLIFGLRFLRLDIVLTSKQGLHRPKDKEHVQLIEQFISLHPDGC